MDHIHYRQLFKYSDMRTRAQNSYQASTQQTEPNTASRKNTDQLVKNFLTALNTNSNNSQDTLESMSKTQTSRHSNNSHYFLNWEENKDPNLDQLQNSQGPYLCKEQLNWYQKVRPSKKIDTVAFQLAKIQIDPLYFQKHRGIKPFARSILLDWLTELCEQFCFSRQTCSQAKTIVDLYLSKAPRLHLQRLQLVGVTALLISSKLKESVPKSSVDMAYATACLYNVDQIREMETEIKATLQFRTKFFSCEECINFILEEWQSFKDRTVSIKELNLKGEEVPLSRVEDCLRSILDIVTLDSQSLNYNYLILSLSLLVLILGHTYGWFQFQEIQYSLAYNCRYLYQTHTYFLVQISDFLLSFDLKLSQIMVSVQFVSSYFFLYDTFEGTQHYYQYYNKYSLDCLKYRKQLVKSIFEFQ